MRSIFVLFGTVAYVLSKDVNITIKNVQLRTGMKYRLTCFLNRDNKPTFNLQVTSFSKTGQRLTRTRFSSLNGYASVCTSVFDIPKENCKATPGTDFTGPDNMIAVSFVSNATHIAVGGRLDLCTEFHTAVKLEDIESFLVVGGELNMEYCEDYLREYGSIFY